MNTENEKHNKRYQEKYKFMKLRIKNMILILDGIETKICLALLATVSYIQQSVNKENAALCDEVAKVQESIMIVKEERKFLLHKILEYENDPDMSHPYTKNEGMNSSNGPKVKLKKRQSLEDSK